MSKNYLALVKKAHEEKGTAVLAREYAPSLKADLKGQIVALNGKIIRAENHVKKAENAVSLAKGTLTDNIDIYISRVREKQNLLKKEVKKLKDLKYTQEDLETLMAEVFV